jgi:hypothetical protein
LRFLLNIAVAVVIAAGLGVGSAWYAVDRGNLFGALTIGLWTAWPDAGGPDADPYASAHLSRTGELALGSGEGIAFTAETDSSGAPLSNTCTYTLSGQTPAAGLWTLTAYDAAGHLIPNPAERTSLDSQEVLRRPDGSVEIALATGVHSGNWLPLGASGPFRLTFRFYDTPLTAGAQIADLMMPTIARDTCK